MQRRNKRLLFGGISFAAMMFVALFIIWELKENISFFYTTSELLSASPEKRSASVRVGGLVVVGSLTRDRGGVTFYITDFKEKLKVTYSGALPPLFGEGVGAIARGRLQKDTFVAEEILAKHDEKYMPPASTEKE